MRKLFIFFSFLLMLSFSPQKDAYSDPVEVKTERPEAKKEFLLNFFEETGEQLADEVRALTSEQMHFRKSSASWSVSQNLEHTIMTEENLFSMVRELLKNPANPERKEEIEIQDQEVIQKITDRSFKLETSEDLQLKGMYDTPEDALSDFEALQTVIVQYIENPDLEFRDFISDSPYGPMDAYQSLLFIAGPTNRHTDQIEEMKNAPDFPK